MGTPTKAEKEFVAQLVQDQPREMTPQQIGSLARTLRRGKAVVKEMVEQARENFVSNSERYVDIHMSATEAALADGDNETAAKAAQWALTNVSSEGSRIIDKASTEPTGARVMVAIQMGGIDSGPKTIQLPAVTSEPVGE